MSRRTQSDPGVAESSVANSKPATGANSTTSESTIANVKEQASSTTEPKNRYPPRKRKRGRQRKHQDAQSTGSGEREAEPDVENEATTLGDEAAEDENVDEDGKS